MFELYQVVRTVVPVPALGLRAGAKGVIVEEYQKPHHAYEIEFIDDSGDTVGTPSLLPNEICGDLPLRLAA